MAAPMPRLAPNDKTNTLDQPITSHKPKQHFRESDPSACISFCRPVLSLLTADRVRVVDPEAGLCPHTETALVLVETGVEQPIVIQLLLAQIHPL